MADPKLPMQPIIRDEGGVLRFRDNALVRYLLDHGGITMNDLALIDFPTEDREQFAQLIGYSVSGWAGLSYVSDASCAVAEAVADGADDERDARIAHLEGELSLLRLALREPVARLYGVHPDDLAAKEMPRGK